MNDEFRASPMWESINSEVFDCPDEIDLARFREGSQNMRLVLWDIQPNALRFYKSLLFNAALDTGTDTLALLDKIPHRGVGNPIQVTVNGRKVCLDYLQAVQEIHFLQDVLDNSESVLEVGAGYGRTCHAILSVFENVATYRIIDLSPCLRLAQRYLGEVLDSTLFTKIEFIPSTDLRSDFNFSNHLTININSMSEMDEYVVRNYLSVIDRSSAYFYSKNPIGKYRPEAVGVSSLDETAFNKALGTGLLRDIIDIFDTEAIAAQTDAFIEAYRPARRWRTTKHNRALPWSYFCQALYERFDAP